MVMKKIDKESLVSISKTKKRFISILLIVLLGVGFFGGIKATSPDMEDTMDKYYKDTNFMDFDLKSTWGVTLDDVKELDKLGYEVEASYEIDSIIELDTEKAVKILSYNKDNDINKIVLVEGTFPKNNNECVVEYMEDSSIKIGDIINVKNDYLIEKELKVVGFVNSPIYTSIEKGSTNLLNGTISFFMYVLEDNIKMDYYTDIYLKLDTNYHTFSDKYDDLVESEEEKLKDITKDLAVSRYNEVVNEYKEEIAKAKEEYNKAYRQYNGLLNSSYVSASAKKEIRLILDNAKKTITEAEKELESLKEPEWYILDRDSNVGFYQFGQDVERISNIAKLFPLVFFVVAILICLTTMTRMVEEERTQLGTLKSLGYTNIQIIKKYVIYASIATIVGSIIGVCIGFYVIPKVIFSMYSLMYSIGDIVINFNIYYTLIGTLMALLCTVGATLITCYKELREAPSQLMRPKSPKAGKKVFLEHFSFIWERLKFSNKVTVRNVFRYKKRFLMTIIGITGCTGLIVAGFGLKDSITVMVPNQYKDLFRYQMSITFDEDLSKEQLDNVVKEIKNNSKIKDYVRVYEESIELDNYDTNQTIQLIVPFDDLDGFIEVRNRETGKDIDIASGVVVSEKLYNLLGMNEDSLLEISGLGKYKAKVIDVCENYIFHYLYMDKELFTSDKYNTIYVKTVSLTEDEENVLAKELKEIDGISSISFLSSRMHTFDETMDNFGLVALVLIVSAGLLAFVVLYNLSTVNISERKRELATIKVLGFYDNEVYSYVGRESNILTGIGIVLGIGFGNILTNFVMKTCELDMMFFKVDITLMSYFFSVVLTVVFTFLVNIMVYFSLKKIDMIESLKSVE